MLSSLKEIGILLGGRKLYDKIEADKVIVLEFDDKGNFLGVELEEFKSENLSKYLYRKRRTNNPPSYTPTLMLSKEKKRTKDKKSPIMKSLDNLEKAFKSCKNVQRDLPPLNFENEKKKIEEKIEEIVKNLPTKVKVLLTIRVGGKYIGEIESFKKALEKLVKQEGTKSKGIVVCSVCLEEKEVSGDVSPFKFYTIDKPGYITGGFKREEAYKNFPLCYECKEYMEAGRKFIEKELKFILAGSIDYFLIPEVIFGNENVMERILEIISNANKKHHLKDSERKHLTADEREILDILSEEKDYLTLNFLFLEKVGGTNRETILLHIQDIYPSRLKELFQAKDYIEKLLTTKDKPFTFTYQTIYKFFSKSDPSKKSPDLKKLFFEIVDKTFRGVPINKNTIIKFLLAKIRRALTEDNYSLIIKDAFSAFLFILFSTGEEEMKEINTSSLDEFLESLPSLDTNLKKGLFLMGALTERLLEVQAKERKGSKPFMKKLKALRMNENDLKGLLPEVRNKLEEYEKFGKGEVQLFELASKYLSYSPPKWNMSIEEMNFYFALGMGMFDIVAELIYKKGGNKDEKQT